MKQETAPAVDRRLAAGGLSLIGLLIVALAGVVGYRVFDAGSQRNRPTASQQLVSDAPHESARPAPVAGPDAEAAAPAFNDFAADTTENDASSFTPAVSPAGFDQPGRPSAAAEPAPSDQPLEDFNPLEPIPVEPTKPQPRFVAPGGGPADRGSVDRGQ